MRDWVFSRQRYWGEPIPLVHCKKCGVISLDEKDLPLKLPTIESYQPTDTGESPLADINDWVNTKCPKCGGSAKRETNTMPQWAGSCWYYLAYITRKAQNAKRKTQNNNSKFKTEKYIFDKKRIDYWLPVDLYVGGAEHATRHLLYARFWHKFLYDIGVVSAKEPFYKFKHVGLIRGKDERKMSKRWNNIVSPDKVINQFGADAFRMYEMFMGPFSDSISWDTAGVKGTKRFLDKIWRYYQMEIIAEKHPDITNQNISNKLQQTINKVTKDIKNFDFNTAISQMMIFINFLIKGNILGSQAEQENMPISKKDLEKFLQILSPFAPHITEELWHQLGHNESIFKSKWPKITEKIVKSIMNIPVMINGKKRALIEIETTKKLSNKEIIDLALTDDNVKKHIKDKKIKKTIYITGKIISIVI